MLTIGKPARFEENGLPIKGQCQPYSHDWQLKYFTKGKCEILFEGTYYICRQLQVECRGLVRIDEIKNKIQRINDEFLDDTQETAVIKDGAILDLTDDPAEAKTGAMLIDKSQIGKKPEDNQNTDQ
ncbi:MAG: hypothetical protein ACYTFY_01260 [Planctomycetota bacterium]|jgi:hypothetical protein